jgi:lipocalin-like protein
MLLSLYKTKSLLLLLISFFIPQAGNIKGPSQFKGIWKLDKYESLQSGNWQTDSSRIGNSGFILYDGAGYMSVQLMPAGYNNFKHDGDLDPLPAEELKDIADHYHSNFVYFASYTVHDNIVEHTVLSCTEPVNIGKVLKREYEFKNDTLILTPITSDIKKSRLRWIRL